MGRASTAAINYVLTNYAQGLMPDLLGIREIVDALCPICPVTGASGQYKQFNDRNQFTVYNTGRGLGGPARRIEFDAADAFFNCAPQALAVAIDDHEREQAGDSPLAQELLDQGKIRALLNTQALSHLDKVITFVVSKLTAVAGRGNWSNPDIDPIAQIDEQLDALATDVGSAQNLHITLGLTSWRTLRSHPKVVGRCTGVQVAGISIEQLRGLLMLPVMPHVGVISKTSNKVGQAAVTKANIVADNVILSYATPNPTPYDPSAFKAFTTGRGLVASVRTLRDDLSYSDVHTIDWSEDLQQTSTLCAKLLKIT